MMTPRQLEKWSIYFMAVASIRFHPRNFPTEALRSEQTGTHVVKELTFSAVVADAMLSEYVKRDAAAYRAAAHGD